MGSGVGLAVLPNHASSAKDPTPIRLASAPHSLQIVPFSQFVDKEDKASMLAPEDRLNHARVALAESDRITAEAIREKEEMRKSIAITEIQAAKQEQTMTIRK